MKPALLHYPHEVIAFAVEHATRLPSASHLCGVRGGLRVAGVRHVLHNQIGRYEERRQAGPAPWEPSRCWQT